MTTPADRRTELRWGLAAITVALVCGLDMGRGGMPFFRDRLYYFLPQYEACRAALAGGEIPLWNPFVNCGQPLLATWQQGLFSPLSLPFLLFPWEEAWRWFWPSALGVAAAGMFAFGRGAGLAPSGAAVAAVVYALSGPLRTLGEWPNIVASLALLPALLAAVAGLARGASGAGAVAVMFALQLLCGQPRQVLISAVAGAGWLLAARGSGRSWRALGAAGVLAAGVALAQLLPTVELYLGSDRAKAGVPIDTVTESFLRLPDFATLIAGRIYGTESLISGPGRLLMPRLTLGWTGLLLAVLGLSVAGTGRRFAALTIPAALLLATGGPHVDALMRLLGAHEPVLRYFGHFILAGWPALALLVGAGAGRLLAGAGAALRVAAAATIAGALWWSPFAERVLMAVADPGPAFRDLRLAEVRIDAIAGAVCACVAAAAAAASRRPGGAPAAIRLLAAAVTLELWWVSRHHEAKETAALFAPGPAATALAAGHDRAFIPPWVGAIHGATAARSLRVSYAARARGLSPNVGMGAGVRNAHGYEPLAPAACWTLFGAWNGSCASVRDGLRATGVRWIVGPTGAQTALPGWTVRDRVAGIWALYEAPGVVPPVRVIAESAAGAAWNRIADAPVAGSAGVAGSTWNTLVIDVTAGRPSRLLTGWLDLPGWTARDPGGARLAVGAAGGVFQSIRVPAGSRTVRLSYAPHAFALGLWLGALALGAVFARAALQ